MRLGGLRGERGRGRDVPARAEAEELRAARQGAALSHRQAGALLGIDARILCALEFRRMTFVDPAGWRWAIDVLRAANVARSGAGGGYVMPFYIRCTLDCGDDLEWYQGHVDGRDVFVSTAERHEKAKPFATAEAGAAFITGTWGRRRRGRQPKVPRVQPFEVVEAPPARGGT